MSRINTNVSSMLAQRVLGQQNQALQKSLERLGTGLRINRGADDPAGLIASENLRAEKAAITAAMGNAERADQVVNVAEGGLTEISNMLTELESLVDSSANDAGLSVEEKEANQLQIDSILQTVDRIANSTSFNGMKLLNGNYDYTTSNVETSNFTVNVNAAKIPDGGSIDVNVDVTSAAQTGQVYLSAGGGNLELAGNPTVTLEVAGTRGTQEFTFASGVAATSMAGAINNFKDVLGVSASVSSTSAVRLDSLSHGGDEFVSVTVVDGNDAIGVGAEGLPGAATSVNETVKDSGKDAEVTINGTNATVDGLTAKVSSPNLDVEVVLSENFNDPANDDNFQITGGGADFQISPEMNLAGMASLALPSLTSAGLGNDSDGSLSKLKSGGDSNMVNGDVMAAQRIVRSAIKDVSTLRGRLGAFQKNTLGSTIRSLGVSLENTSAAESQIRDTDFAEETANLTRSQILTQAASNALSLANNQPQSVLQLLG